jgi:hypothetical protein
MPARSPPENPQGPAIDEDAQKKCAALVPFIPSRATALEIEVDPGNRTKR